MKTDMHRFAPLLERASRELDLPQPEKSRVLQEIAADAAGLYGSLRARGVGDGAARRQVEAWLTAAPAALRELEEIHRPIYVRWASRLSQPRRHRLERTAFACVVVAQLAGAVPLLRSGAFVRAPAATGWIVLGLAVVVVSIAVERVFSLWVRKAHGARERRRWLTVLGAAAVAAPSVAFLGAALTVAGIATSAAPTAAAWRAIEAGAGLLAAGVLIGLLAASVLFVVETRIRWIEYLDQNWEGGGA